MRKGIIIIAFVVFALIIIIMFTGCQINPDNTTATGSRADTANTIEAANTIQGNQLTPTDIEYSLERYNLIRRAYWVNGEREKANTLICEIEKPLGYIVLFAGNATVGSFIVDGKVSSLNSYLTPDSEYYETAATGEAYSIIRNRWLADVDGTYGTNDNGIFFFTPDGKYIEWTGEYLYSDIPFIVDSAVVTYEVAQ